MDLSQWVSEMIDSTDCFSDVLSLVSSYGSSIVFFGIAYVCQSVGLSTIARRREIPMAWLAWLPLGNLWVLGSISDHYRLNAVEQICNKKRTLLLLGLSCLTVVVLFAVGMWAVYTGKLQEELPQLPPAAAAIGFVALILLAMGLWVLLRVTAYMALFDVYRSCAPGKAVVYLLIGILAYVLQPFLVFALRKKDAQILLKRKPRSSYAVSQCEF